MKNTTMHETKGIKKRSSTAVLPDDSLPWQLAKRGEGRERRCTRPKKSRINLMHPIQSYFAEPRAVRGDLSVVMGGSRLRDCETPDFHDTEESKAPVCDRRQGLRPLPAELHESKFFFILVNGFLKII